jgi:hypothetical protein
MKNEDAILDLLYEHLDVMKMGDAFATILEKFNDEDEQEQVFGEIVLPQVILAFAKKYADIVGDDDPTGEDLQNFFEAFCHFENISEDLGNVVAATINELSKGALQGYIKGAKADALKTINAPVDLSNRSNNDPKAWGRIVKRTKGVDLAKKRLKLSEADDDGIISQDEWDKLTDQQRITKVRNVLKAIANTGNNFRDLKPFIKRVPKGSDYLGNDFGKNAVRVFDRMSNRYGADPENPTTPKGTNAYLQRKPLPNLPIQESLLDVNSASKVERYARWMNNNPVFLKTYSDSRDTVEALHEAGKLRDEAEKKFGLGLDPSEWEPGFHDRITKGRSK